jgi:uncharacterized protein (DUF1800 family)
VRANRGRAVEHLLTRATYGLTDDLVHEATRHGAQRWLDDQLDPHRVDDKAMDRLLTRWPSLTRNTWQTRNHLADNMGAWDVMLDLVDAHIARAIWSKRQLFELMVDFWSNHFNVTCPSSDVWDNRHVFDRETIRPHALGRFSDLLRAVAHAPAMLVYLGNADSTAAAPNENWGRELLELHTVGLAAGYSQRDVRHSALILTGLSVEPDGGEFEYKPWMHHVGHVRVLGFHAANSSHTGGKAVAMSYLHYLAHHRDTARHLATKLAIRFVCDDPPKRLVDRLAHTYLHHGTAIVPVLRELFASPEFADSAGAKVRTPFENFVATLRALGVRPPAHGTAGIRDLQWMTADAGQPPLGWYAPNGYPDTAAAWATTSTALGRWNAHLNFAAQWWPDKLRWQPMHTFVPHPRPKTYGALVDTLAARLHVPALGEHERRAIATFLGHHPHDLLHPDDDALGWRLPDVLALVLDSYKQALR